VDKAKPVDDDVVAVLMGELLGLHPHAVRGLMREWTQPILKTAIPGSSGRVPSKSMLDAAKRAVLNFYERERSLGERSVVAQAFYLVSGELHLRFDWARAIQRVQRASLDLRQKIDKWDECLAMSCGDTNELCEIYVCGTKRITVRALTSLVCHEGLHNLARRTRPGNSFLSEALEHQAMALLGDPQLVAA